MENFNVNLQTIDCIIRISQLMESLRTTKVGKIRELRDTNSSIINTFGINHDNDTFDTAIKIIKLNQLKGQIDVWGGGNFLTFERNLSRANNLADILSIKGVLN